MTAPAAPRRRNPGPNSPFSYVPEAQDYLREGVQGFGDTLQPQILKEIGSTLGGLNEIGGLRSGGTTVALGDITQKYADIIGAHARQATQYGLEAGLGARRQKFQEDEAKRARKHGLLKAIGSVLGAGVGFIAAGPAGAAAGAKIGGSVGPSPGLAWGASDAGGMTNAERY
jgi:hypothetical protein